MIFEPLIFGKFQEVFFIAVHFKMVDEHGENETSDANSKKTSGRRNTSPTETYWIEISIANRQERNND